MKWHCESDWLVFTDLDGTLLDHNTYRFDEASMALEMLKEEGIPVIINTSKTFKEVLLIREGLGNIHPFIAENGSLVALPGDYFPARVEMGQDIEYIGSMLVEKLGGSRDDILAVLNTVRSENGFKFTGFEDMSSARLSRLTGLTEEEAGLAKQRLSTEPILWQDDAPAWERFQACLEAEGLQWVQGGRFISISRPYDKKDGVARLKDIYRSASGREFKTVGLGDSPNDQGMLDMMTIAVIIASDRSERVLLEHPQEVIRTRERGPKGWQTAIEKIFKSKKRRS